MNFDEAVQLLENLSEGINDPGIFKAVFTAGGPGSGKSTVANKMGLFAMGLRPINSDTAFENALKKEGLSLKLDTIDPEVIDTMRVKAKQLSSKQMDLALKGRLGLVIDSTARNTTKIAKQKELLEKIGYETAMLFVDTSLDTALERNQMRARSVPEKVVVKSHKEIQTNKKKLERLFGRNYWEIKNDGDMKDLEKNTTKWFSKVRGWVNNLKKNELVKSWMSKFEEFTEEMAIDELDMRSPAKRDVTRMQASLSAGEKKLMKKMIANPKTAIRDLQITIDVFKKQMAKGTRLTQPLIKAQIDKYENWLKMLTPKGMVPVAEAFNDEQLALLRKEYSKIKKVDPNGAALKKLKKFIKGANRENLAALANAKPPIPWLSMLARFELNEDVTDEEIEDFITEKKSPYQVKFAKSRRGKISVVDYDDLEDAKQFLADVRKSGYNGIVSQNGKPVKEEIVTTNAIPQGPESVGVKPDSKFAGNPVFDCDDATFSNCIKGKKKYGRWSAYLGKDNPFFEKMKSWMSQSYKNKNFILRNANSGAMVYARNPLGESLNELFDNRPLTKKEQTAFNQAMKRIAKKPEIMAKGMPTMTGNALTQKMKHVAVNGKDFTITLSKQKDPFKTGDFYDIRFKNNPNSSGATQSKTFIKEEDIALLKSELTRFENGILKKELMR